MLPEMFVKIHWKLSNVVHLRLPDGTYWEGELFKCKGNVWLHKGWNRFAKHYSISSGYLLIFRYDGNSHFRVFIHNTTALQIEYPPIIKIEDTTEGESDEDPVKQRNAQNVLHDVKKCRVEQSANDFHGPNLHFKAEMKSGNFNGNTGPIMPVSHGRLYVESKRKNVVLQIKDKTWHIDCRRRVQSRPFDVAMTTEWQKFVLENALQEGDSCVFELVDIATMTYNVHITQVSKVVPKVLINEKHVKPGRGGIKEKLSGTTRCKNALAVEAVKERLMKKAKAFMSGSPSFSITMKKTYTVSNRSVHVPHYHSKEYMKEEGDGKNAIVVHGKDEGCWEIKYNEDSTGTCLTNSGWRKFREENGLKMGDVCAFKLINKVKKAYQVAIFKINGK